MEPRKWYALPEPKYDDDALTLRIKEELPKLYRGENNAACINWANTILQNIDTNRIVNILTETPQRVASEC